MKSPLILLLCFLCVTIGGGQPYYRPTTTFVSWLQNQLSYLLSPTYGPWSQGQQHYGVYPFYGEGYEGQHEASTSTIQGPTYTIIAPAKLRPNSEYHVSLQLANATKPVDIDVELAGGTEGEPTVNRVAKSVVVNPSETSVVNLGIGKWPAGKYRLTVSGKSDELDFKNETEIGYEAKSFSVFVQTDKAMYKPGQVVKFRAIIVNPELVPNVSGTVDVYIKVSDSGLSEYKLILMFLSIGLKRQPDQTMETPHATPRNRVPGASAVRTATSWRLVHNRRDAWPEVHQDLHHRRVRLADLFRRCPTASIRHLQPIGLCGHRESDLHLRQTGQRSCNTNSRVRR